MKTILNKYWLCVAYLIETFQLTPTDQRVQIMIKKHSLDMDDLRRFHAHELQREETEFVYRLDKERARANFLSEKVETIREFHGVKRYEHIQYGREFTPTLGGGFRDGNEETSS
jgi:hypothetical protein